MYNDSELSKDQWEEAEAACSDDEVLKIIWRHYKKSFNGTGKNIIKTFDTYISFVEAAVDTYCSLDGVGDVTNEELIEVGFSSDEDAMRKARLFKLITNKDDKGTDRIKDMLKSLGDIYSDRQKILEGLGRDDKEEVEQSMKSGAVRISEEYKKRNGIG